MMFYLRTPTKVVSVLIGRLITWQLLTEKKKGTLYFSRRKQSNVIACIFLVATETDLLWEMQKPPAGSQAGYVICIEEGADCGCPDLSSTGRASEIMGPRIQSSILIQTDTHNMERPDGLNERQKRWLLPSPQEERKCYRR